MTATTYTEVEALLLEVMNLGMDTRQKQLQGSERRSGKEILAEFWDKNKKK